MVVGTEIGVFFSFPFVDLDVNAGVGEFRRAVLGINALQSFGLESCWLSFHDYEYAGPSNGDGISISDRTVVLQVTFWSAG
jgi:hypothetical protein